MKLTKILKNAALAGLLAGIIAVPISVLKYQEKIQNRRNLLADLYRCALEEKSLIRACAYGEPRNEGELSRYHFSPEDRRNIIEYGSMNITSPARHDGILQRSNFKDAIGDFYPRK